MPRTDGKANPENINMSKEEADEVITSLTETNYFKTYDRIPEDPNCQYPVDIYKVKNYLKNRDGSSIDLYIKFHLNDDDTLVIVISFHDDVWNRRYNRF